MATKITYDMSAREIQAALLERKYRQNLEQQQKVPSAKPFSPTTKGSDLQGRVSTFLHEHGEEILVTLFMGLGVVLSIYLMKKGQEMVERSSLVSRKNTQVTLKEYSKKRYDRYAKQKEGLTNELAQLRKDEARREDRMKEAFLESKIKTCESMMSYHQSQIAKYDSQIAQIDKELKAFDS